MCYLGGDIVNSFLLNGRTIKRTDLKKIRQHEVHDKTSDGVTDTRLIRRSYRGNMVSLSLNEVRDYVSKVSRTVGKHPIPLAGDVQPLKVVAMSTEYMSAFNLLGEEGTVDNDLRARLYHESIRSDIHGSGGTYLFVLVDATWLYMKYGEQGNILWLVDLGCLIEALLLEAEWSGYVGCIHFFQKDVSNIETSLGEGSPICMLRVGIKKG
jgi:hypothetical protein